MIYFRSNRFLPLQKGSYGNSALDAREGAPKRWKRYGRSGLGARPGSKNAKRARGVAKEVRLRPSCGETAFRTLTLAQRGAQSWVLLTEVVGEMGPHERGGVVWRYVFPDSGCHRQDFDSTFTLIPIF